MNQIRDWDGHCQRCFLPASVHTMSMFDVSLICMNCWENEKNHSKYKEAQAAESKAVQSGDRNFKGIGWTDDQEDDGSCGSQGEVIDESH